MTISSLVRLSGLPTAFLVMAAFPPAVRAQRSHAMAAGCRGASANTPANRQRAEQWVRDRLAAFVPRPEQSLRMRSLELQAEQVKLAFYGISSTCEQYLAGTLAQADADLSLSGFEQTIADFLHDLGNEVVPLAARGQVSDMESIRKTMTDIGTAGRQAALLGEDELAEQSRQKLVDAVVSFSRTFQEACFDQSFDPRIALALERQNELLGTGIDVTPCARRKFVADATGSGITWHFSHCGEGIGEWRIETSGPFTGKGIATIDPTLHGTWYVDETSGGMRLEYTGSATVVMRPAASETDIPVMDRLEVLATSGTATDPDGEVVTVPLQISGFKAVVKTSDKPCRPEEAAR